MITIFNLAQKGKTSSERTMLTGELMLKKMLNLKNVKLLKRKTNHSCRVSIDSCTFIFIHCVHISLIQLSSEDQGTNN